MKKSVPRSKAVVQSGPKKGKLKKGCKFTKSGAVCEVGKATRRRKKRK
jgi:hypothetical protein